MSTITISPKKALRREFIEATILSKMNPELGFLNLFPKVNLEGATTFEQYVDDTNAEDDIKSGVLGEPIELGELSRLSEIEVSSINRVIGDTKEFGFNLRFSKDVLKQNHKIDEILRAYQRAGFAMNLTINNMILNTIKTYAGATPITLNDGSWTTSEKIPEDIIDMQKAFEQVGYDYTLTDMYIGKDSWYGAKKLYNALEVNGFTPNDMEGSTLHKVHELDSDLIGLDMNVKPLTIYYNVDSDLSTMPDSFINVNKYQEQKHPRNIVIEITAQMGIGVKHARGMLYQTGV